MIIDAPFTIGIVDKQDTGTRELHLTFTESFRSKSVQERGEIFSRFVESRQETIDSLDDDSADKIGVLTIHQISTELRPHIAADEIALLDTIIVEMGQDAMMFNLINEVPIQ